MAELSLPSVDTFQLIRAVDVLNDTTLSSDYDYDYNFKTKAFLNTSIRGLILQIYLKKLF